jgi:hypothetical protein
MVVGLTPAFWARSRCDRNDSFRNRNSSSLRNLIRRGIVSNLVSVVLLMPSTFRWQGPLLNGLYYDRYSSRVYQLCQVDCCIIGALLIQYPCRRKQAPESPASSLRGQDQRGGVPRWPTATLYERQSQNLPPNGKRKKRLLAIRGVAQAVASPPAASAKGPGSRWCATGRADGCTKSAAYRQTCFSTRSGVAWKGWGRELGPAPRPGAAGS